MHDNVILIFITELKSQLKKSMQKIIVPAKYEVSDTNFWFITTITIWKSQLGNVKNYFVHEGSHFEKLITITELGSYCGNHWTISIENTQFASLQLSITSVVHLIRMRDWIELLLR